MIPKRYNEYLNDRCTVIQYVVSKQNMDPEKVTISVSFRDLILDYSMKQN